MLAKYADSPNWMVRKELARTRQVLRRTASLHISTAPAYSLSQKVSTN